MIKENNKIATWRWLSALIILVASTINIFFHIKKLPPNKDFFSSIHDMTFLNILSLYAFGFGLLILLLAALSKIPEIIRSKNERHLGIVKKFVGLIQVVVFFYILLVLENLFWEKELVFNISNMRFF
ncbi:MAG: hypothetical protein EPN25_02065, partial [Nitrospirae bacterium]